MTTSTEDNGFSSEELGSTDVQEWGGGGCSAEPRILYVVSVPIGNLGDFTRRALEILSSVDVVASEEVQATRRLLHSQNIHVRLVSYRESGRERAGAEILSLLKNGQKVALVSGAGTPAVSDPGRDIVERCHAEGIRVCPILGASALTAAVAAAGIPCRRLVFEGFLSRNASECRQRLLEMAEEQRTMVFFEAPHRVLKTLECMLEVFGERRAFIGRELTKRFEECRVSTLAQLCQRFRVDAPRGEFVIVVEGCQPREVELELSSVAEDLEYLQGLGLSARGMAGCLERFRGIKRNLAKKWASEWMSQHDEE